MQDLGTLGGCSSNATAINLSGVLIGESDTNSACDALWEAFVCSGGQMKALGIPPGTNVSKATGINDSGVICGYGGADVGDINIGFVVRGSGLEGSTT